MGMTREIRLAGAAALLGACAVLSGCIGGPTYGTDKSSGEQLMDDLGNAVMLKPGNGNDKKIAYQPRGGLVVPKQGEAPALVEPQKTLASTEDNPQWVESPEDMRDRLKEEATENERSIGYNSPLQTQNNTMRKLSTKEQLEQYREARKLEQGLYSDKRRYLSDPPLDYRKLPAEATEDLGEPERKKERRRKKEAEVANSGAKKWWPF
ncbi:hypothetical protein OCK02_04170 (plasmid) [Rhizobium sp. TRM96647]|uniref:hypothetical protein n=1 Tax=unclassified Rhizobium TaxID=2613769 RepID=UPI0021E80BF7|nr:MULTISPECIES: hypothetical protein [unclassified Rhizobium]MCV3735390.1 hypothetical protein [Rhizobium sp. TRM96647]MCV3757847.1 hypothetical protein [Rhizobium sp. TRM96650]